MLRELVVEGLGVIERADLQLEPGCSALTGETGAGKTLMVAALSLLVGGRSDRTLVREGAPEALVEGRFVVSPEHDAVAVLRANGIISDHEDGPDVEIVLTRTITADGQGGRARVNGRLATVALLAELGACLVEIAGQHEARGIGAPLRQRSLLDSFAGARCRSLAAELVDTMRSAAETQRTLDALLTGERERERELDLLRYEIGEIAGAGLEEGESADLSVDAARLEHAETIALALGRATEALNGEGGATDTVDAALRDVTTAAHRDPSLGEAARRLESAALELSDVADDLGRSVVTPDPRALEETRARLDAIARLTRKYGERDALDHGGSPESRVLDYRARAEARVGELESAESRLGEMRAAHERLMARAEELATELGSLREEAAPRLARAMEEVLGDLALAGARFEVVLSARDLFEGGREAVEFRVSANPGESARPVAKVASGGELSRIALALHLLTSDRVGRGGLGDDRHTLVFDEVDAGVGGQAAQSVGRALAQLARNSDAQVVLVTHLPQVAAFGDFHYRVTKEASDHRTTARVTRVTGSERVDELSRMLAGMPECERAREHARELLETASIG